MDNAETLDEQLTMICEKLTEFGDGNNEQLPGLDKYVQDEICALIDVDAPLRELVMNNIASSFDEQHGQDDTEV